VNWRYRWRHEPFKTACKLIIFAAIVAFAGFMAWLPVLYGPKP
jgi:hypothetical protein